MTVPFMEALARHDLDGAGREVQASVTAWLADGLQSFVQFRLGQLAADPTIREWLGRSMVVTDQSGERQVIGAIGFHGPPDADGRVEVGYRVDPSHRRQGYAREAIRSLFDWAYSKHGVERFVASIAPDNEPSLRLAAEFGFKQVGEQIDEIDGLELVFETGWP